MARISQQDPSPKNASHFSTLPQGEGWSRTEAVVHAGRSPKLAALFARNGPLDHFVCHFAEQNDRPLITPQTTPSTNTVPQTTE